MFFRDRVSKLRKPVLRYLYSRERGRGAKTFKIQSWRKGRLGKEPGVVCGPLEVTEWTAPAGKNITTQWPTLLPSTFSHASFTVRSVAASHQLLHWQAGVANCLHWQTSLVPTRTSEVCWSQPQSLPPPHTIATPPLLLTGTVGH